MFKKIMNFFGRKSEAPPEQGLSMQAKGEKQGRTSGELLAEGVPEDETVAVILAAVSDYTNIPMHALKIVSIKAV